MELQYHIPDDMKDSGFTLMIPYLKDLITWLLFIKCYLGGKTVQDWTLLQDAVYALNQRLLYGGVSSRKKIRA